MDYSKPADQKRGRGRPMNKLHQDDVRSKISVGQLLKTLQDHALNGGEEFPASRMKAIEILLRKSLPDLSSIELSGSDTNPIKVVYEWSDPSGNPSI